MTEHAHVRDGCAVVDEFPPDTLSIGILRFVGAMRVERFRKDGGRL